MPADVRTSRRSGPRCSMEPMNLPSFSVIALAACATLSATPLWSQSAKSLTPVLIDSDANNELDDQHAIAYMLFSGDAFDVEGISVNRTRSGGDIEMQAREAERIVQFAGLARVFPVPRREWEFRRDRPARRRARVRWQGGGRPDHQ